MSPQIAVLAARVADQIAAGEVVERPASVVKELVENALDAGAHTIRVALEDGGRTLIRVSDDGEGMSRADATLALERHATSKIRQAADLVGIATFGFRGEALPAIASIARLELETAAPGEIGTRLRVAGGTREGVEDAPRQRGTTVTVRALFFNTPARRKFLRAPATETRAAAEVVSALALARPDVAFRLTSDERVLIEAPTAADRRERVAALWGQAFADTLLPVSHRDRALLVTGFAQRPSDARPTGRRAHVFLGGRPIRDPFLLRAAEAGYRSTITAGDRPSTLLFLELPGDVVDVNVHPAKLEVRFHDRFWVERAVEHAVGRALAPLAAARSIGAPATTPAEVWAGGGPQGVGEVLELWAEASVPGAAAAPLQAFDTFLVCADDDALTIVDQHSAHERVLYERVLARLAADETAPAQRLLLPLTLELGPAELEASERHAALLARIGYELAPFSGRTVAVLAVPNPHPRFDAGRCLQELLADLAGDRFGAWPNGLERFAALYACRAAIKAGLHLEPAEVRHLVADLGRTRLPAHDVHGRSGIVRLSREELERRFGRR